MLTRYLTRLSAAGLIACVTILGCGTTRVTFLDSSDDLVRIGPDVSGRVYFYKDGSWVLSKNKVKLPEGWYAGPLPREE